MCENLELSSSSYGMVKISFELTYINYTFTLLTNSSLY